MEREMGGAYSDIDVKTSDPREFIESLRDWIGEYLNFEIIRGRKVVLSRKIGMVDWEGYWEYKGKCVVVLLGREGDA